MATIKGFKDKWDKFYSTLPDAVAAEVERTKDVLLSLNEDQLLYGRDAKGDPLTPDYADDPYFEGDLKAAIRYKRMKTELEDEHWSRIRFGREQLFPDKSGDTPNLIVTGTQFMNHLAIDVNRDSYTIGSSGKAAGDIKKKYESYGHPVFGIAPASAKYYYFGFIRPNAILGHYKKCMAK